jgi:hypothetical protein
LLTPTVARLFASSAPGSPPVASEGFVRKASEAVDDELLPEYDFSALKGGVRGKYSRRYRAGVNLARLEPAVAKAFPTDAAVNEALRTVLRASRALKRTKRLPNTALQRTSARRRARSRARR